MIVGLDLGTVTGIAVSTPAGISARSIRLASARALKDHDRTTEDPRFEALVAILRTELEPYRGHNVVVAWEDVQFASTLYQIQLWTTLRSAVWVVCTEFGVTSRMSVPVGALKKFATGSGAAKKDAMLRAAVARGLVPADTGLDDNAIDALWVALWAKTLWGKTSKQ